MSSVKWAARVVKHVWSLGLPVSFAHDNTGFIDKSGFRRRAAGRYKLHEIWQGLHGYPRSASSKGGAHHHKFACVDP